MFSNGLTPWHLLIVLVAAVLLFGGTRLPGAARGIGQALRIFKAEVTAKDDPKPAATDQAPASPPQVTDGQPPHQQS